ncbi:ADP-glyceromanno-heptose 6-epimerase [Parasediminibacterium paludis]|uniref:ADP-glyceromanno-heptose 6-epimerase n=1 Tax=Parasediminibacterium paludis TaxID=908966 RepID=A0ABV8PYL0_9BACT
MNKNAAIIITGAAGFIGSCMVKFLNVNGYNNLVLVDAFGIGKKRQNWVSKKYVLLLERDIFFDWLDKNNPTIDLIIHLGARTDTTEFDYSIHEALNVIYSQKIWKFSVKNQIPLIYASSAATYGNGEHGYNDNHSVPFALKPLNPYGVSKNEFDKWAINQNDAPPFWAGLKFFNIYGPNEYHKARMASVIWHSFNQIKANGLVKLFKSHNPNYKDGQQLRDFVYVKDLVKVILWMAETGFQNSQFSSSSKSEFKLNSGIYNLGTGQARSFLDLAVATFRGLDLDPRIKFVDMPIDLRDKYQYFTEANMAKLTEAGYTIPFYSLEEGVDDYVRHYLATGKFY